MLDELLDWLADSAGTHPAGQPVVTLSYAQSLDGSLAGAAGRPLALSGLEALSMTHTLRARHDAILVGIGTVLADNPRLNVRFASGFDPRPVVLDTQLRMPETCHLLDRKQNLPWIAAGTPVDPGRRGELEARGARVLELPREEDGRVDLRDLLKCLSGMGIRSLMVEGGAAVIRSFLRQGLANRAVITIAPVFVGGLTLAGNEALSIRDGTFPELDYPVSAHFGKDVVVWGTFREQPL